MDALRDILPVIASHPDLTSDFREIIEAYCASIPLLRSFTLDDTQVEEAVQCANTLAGKFWAHWPLQDNLFPYFHTCDIELQRELPYVHKTYGVRVGAFVCQGVEALGHHIKVAAQNTESNFEGLPKPFP